MARKIRLNTRTVGEAVRERFAGELNPAQLAAATAPDGFNLIIAGPGSGKTRVITYRVAYLIATGVPAEGILLVTFTRKAAREMVGRLESLIGSAAHRVWAGTFHHIGNRIIRRSAKAVGLDPSYTILDSEDATGLVKLAMEEVGLVLGKKSAGGPRADALARLISLAFNTGRSLREVVALERPDLNEWVEEMEEAAEVFGRRKREANTVDYDDLLGLWGQLVKAPGLGEGLARSFRHILVDELQDTNIVQMELVERMAKGGSGNLTGVGDDAQAIYRFRGAHYDNMLRFPDRNPGTNVYRLEVNYRSSPEIVAFVNGIIAPAESNFPKTLVSGRSSGAKPEVIAASDAFEEADAIVSLIREIEEEGLRLSDIAVLYRNSYDSTILEETLVRNRIAYEVRGGQRFFEKAHIKDALAYLRVLANPRDQLAWDRLLLMLEGVGPAGSAKIRGEILRHTDPLEGLETAEVMGRVAPRSKGAFATFVADMRALRASKAEKQPAEGVAAILRGHFPEFVRRKYSDQRPENRLAEIEQLGALASRYDDLEKFLSDLVLSGDLYGQEDEGGGGPDRLVLSTIHQAKGLEWSRVIVLRVVEGSLPNERSLREPGGEEEERRLFYVAASRAQDELYLSYPLTVYRPGVGGVLSHPSRFLTKLDRALYEESLIETENDLSWTVGFHGRGGGG